jgi:hypothetical protein
MARQLVRSPCKVLKYQAPRSFTAPIRKVFGWTLELRDEPVSQTTLFDTSSSVRLKKPAEVNQGYLKELSGILILLRAVSST